VDPIFRRQSVPGALREEGPSSSGLAPQFQLALDPRTCETKEIPGEPGGGVRQTTLFWST